MSRSVYRGTCKACKGKFPKAELISPDRRALLCPACRKLADEQKAKKRKVLSEVVKSKTRNYDVTKGRECTKCKVFKSPDAFNRTSTMGLQSICKACNRAKNMSRKYGITHETFLAMYEQQGKKCCICKEEFPVSGLFIDHCHNAGHVRGLLCNMCNTLLGNAKDRVDILQSAISYLSR